MPQIADNLEVLLTKFFAELEKKNIKYCLLRNYELLPQDVGNDLDLLIQGKDTQKFQKCVFAVAHTLNWKLLRVTHSSGHSVSCLFNPDTEKSITIDQWSSFNYKGIIWADGKKILDRRVKFNNFFIPQKSDEVATLLIKDLIQNGAVREKYHNQLQEQLNNGIENDIAEFIRWSLGDHISKNLISEAKKGNWENVNKQCSNVRFALVKSALLRNPLKMFFGVLHFLFGYIYGSFAKSSGLFITLIGPDGSGKSTIANGLTKSFNQIFSKITYYHGHFKILPELKAYKNPGSLIDHFIKKKQPAINYEFQQGDHANMGKPYNFFKAMMYLLYYLWDYFLGHFKVLFSRAKGDMIIFDRYFYDYIIQPSFDKLPKWLVFLIMKMLPKPNLVIYLKCDPQVIHQRKPELTVELITKQQKKIEWLLDKFNAAVTIDTSKDTEEARKELFSVIIDRLDLRTQSKNR